MTLIAVVGGGQLGRMLALAGYPLGLRFRFLDPDPDCPAGQVGELVVGAYDDLSALRTLVRGSSVATYEFENVPHATAAWLAEHREAGFAGVFPPPAALDVAQDRVAEKTFFRAVGIPTADFAVVDDAHALSGAVAAVGVPAILKTRRFGYDGKGQCVIRSADEALAAWRSIAGGGGGVPCILEAMVPFEREVSAIGVRGRDGSIVVYPLVENVHAGGILRTSRAPAVRGGVAADEVLARSANKAITRLLEDLDYVGVLCVEFFVHPPGEGGREGGNLLANEMAPRVHNSGHWTIDGAVTSQFENHLRAILGLPLGETAMRGDAAMVNLIGDAPPLERLLAIANANVHLYGKSPRPGRKLGHVTIVGSSAGDVQRGVESVEALMSGQSVGRR